MNIPEIIEAIPLREQIADIIRGMIVSGELKSEQKLSERQISRLLNVSTTPVKEAFRLLQSEGMIYSVPRKGSFVSSHSLENLRQIIYLRSAIDGVAAFFAAKHASQEKIDQMREALENAGQEIEKKGDTNIISRNNDIFHMILRESTNNELIINLGATMRAIDNSIRKEVNRTGYEEIKERQVEHEAILQALIDKESEKAEELMRAHVRIGSVRKTLKTKE